MRRSEDWVKLGAFAILAMLAATTVLFLIEFVGGRTVAMLFGVGVVAGACYWACGKRSEGRGKRRQEAKKKEAPSAEYNHDLTRKERRELSKEMRELEAQWEKPSKPL
jgi:Flp pilus assembly protein TadB